MLDILVTVGVILVLIALAALLLHLINTHHEQRIAAAHYERFHPGDPPRPHRSEREGEKGRDEARRRDEGGGGPPSGEA
ncbi:hypothetical protein [Streptomyces winkii]|uniref:hypothetical protein n=1 Tax=Streptomyces winkii TaxID=3051178 RepID=UPI0028D0170A|nr:hypothetical protein [Streptomyces sp. DSM 40971]